MAVAAAGCVGGGSGGAPSVADAGDDANEAGPANDTSELPLLEAPRQVTLYLAADGTLVADVPPAGHIVQGDLFSDYMQGAADVDRYTLRSSPLVNATLIHAEPVQVTMWIESDTPQGPFPGINQVGAGAFFGGTKGMPVLALEVDRPVFLPGTPTRFDLELAFGDLVPVTIPAGESYAFFGGLVATTTDQTPARILVGGEHASSVTFTASNMTRDPLAEVASPPEGEVITGTIQKQGDPAPEHSFTVGANATELEIRIRATGGHASDLDIDLYDAAGTGVSGSHTPATYESIYLMGPTLEGLRGTSMRIAVGHFYAAQAEYELTISQR